MKIIRDMEGILEVMRAKRDALNISHETIDNISGLPSGYTSKVLAPEPQRGVGYQSLGDLMGALAIGFIPVDDHEQIERVKSRLKKRDLKRVVPGSYRKALSMRLASSGETQENPEQQRKLRMQELGRKGGKRRLQTMSKRARQRVASHAARIRWEKHRKS